MPFIKIFGSFRWLAFLSGAAAVGIILWLVYPGNADNVIPNGGKTSEIVHIVHDSSGIEALRDSLAVLRSRTQTVRVIRVTVRDSIDGVETVYLDSGAVTRDTVAVVRVVSDTVSVTVHDTVYRAASAGTREAGENEFSGTAYYDESGKPGARLKYSRHVLGPLYGVVYADYQDSLESGLGVGAEWKIFRAQAVVRNYGYRSMDLGYELSGGISVKF